MARASLQTQFLSNYEFRCSLLRFCKPKDILSLMKAFAPKICLTEREKKEHLGLFKFFFKDDNLIDRLCESNTKIAVICKDLGELLNIYHDTTKGCGRIFDVIIMLSTGYKIIPFYPDMIGTAFREWTLCPVAVASEWYVSSAMLNHAQIKLHFMSSKRGILDPLRLPFGTAIKFMDVKVLPNETAPDNIEATTKYLHLHEHANTYKIATSLPFGRAHLWTGGAVLGFRVTVERGQDVEIPITL